MDVFKSVLNRWGWHLHSLDPRAWMYASTPGPFPVGRQLTTLIGPFSVHHMHACDVDSTV